MRLFYSDEGPIDTLLQIASQPVRDGDLIHKQSRDKFFALGWVMRGNGWNILLPDGENVIAALKLHREEPPEADAPPRVTVERPLVIVEP